MGGYFQITDDRASQRLILRRVNEPGVDVIWLDADPTGTGVVVIDAPACLSKIDLGSAKLGTAYAIPYKSGVAISLSTDLHATSTATIGSDATWSVVAAGGRAPYSYQWYFNGALINPLFNPSASTATLTIRAVSALSDGDYYCLITGADGAQVASTVSRFTATAAQVTPPLSWKTNLSATQSVATAAAGVLTVEIQGGKSPYAFTWTKDGGTATGVTTGSKSELHIASATSNDAGKYKVTVTDADGKTLTSAECTVTVTTT